MNKAPWPYRTIVTANSAFIKSIVCLGQREGDIIIMPRSAYDPIDGSIVISQHKTGQRVAVPVLPELKREIDITPKIGTILVVSEKSGRPYKEHHFRHVHRKICRAAGIPDSASSWTYGTPQLHGSVKPAAPMI